MSTDFNLLAVGTEIITLGTAETGYISSIEFRTDGIKQAFYIVHFPDRKLLAAQFFAYPVTTFLDLCGYLITPENPAESSVITLTSKVNLKSKSNRALKSSFSAYLYNEAYQALRAYHHYANVSVTVSTFYAELAKSYKERLEHLRLLDYKTFMKAVKSRNAYLNYVYGFNAQ